MHTARGLENIARDLAYVTGLPVLGTDKKTDLYNVPDRGEDLQGGEGMAFVFYIPEGINLQRHEICQNKIKVLEAFKLIQKMRGIVDQQ